MNASAVYLRLCLLLGLVYVNPFIDSITKVDVRTKSLDVPPQEAS